MGEPARTGIEALFPPAAGIMALLLVTGALFAAPASVAVLLTGIFFFGAGLLFSRSKPRFPLGAGLAILAPFLLLSVFLVTAFGARLLVFPVLAAGGVASGLAIRRRGRSGAGGFVLGALWVGFVAVVAFLVFPGMFGSISFTGFAPR
jgi:hypothetical protein